MDHDDNPLDLERQDEQRAERRDEDDRARKQFEEDLKWFLNHKQGRRIMWRWLSEAGVFRSVWRPSANEMNLAEGKRVAGLDRLNEILAVSPDMFTTMMKEAYDDAKRRSRRT